MKHRRPVHWPACLLGLSLACSTNDAAPGGELGSTLSCEPSINQMLAQILLGFDRVAWQKAPVRYSDFDARVGAAKQWLAERRTFLAAGVQ